MRKISVLGATGSIGLQTLDILKYSYDYELVGITFFSNYSKIEPYLPYFPKLKYVGIIDEKIGKEFKKKYPIYKVIIGKDANKEIINLSKAKYIFNSIIGNDGLIPSLVAIKNNCTLLLTNKESLVIGGKLIKEALTNSKSIIYPVDSEHVALNKLLDELKRNKINNNHIEKYIITASGGALRDYKKEDLENVKKEDVLKHPTWHMGNKITIDSATLVNKAFEIIEASVLFNIDINKIDAVICRESLIHAMIKLDDGTYLKEFSPVDMKVAITYALSRGKTKTHKLNSYEEEKISKLHIEDVNHQFYPCFDLTLNMYKRYHELGMIYFNMLDSKLIELFLKDEIKYNEIYKGLNYLYNHFNYKQELKLENIESILIDAKKEIDEILNSRSYLK